MGVDKNEAAGIKQAHGIHHNTWNSLVLAAAAALNSSILVLVNFSLVRICSNFSMSFWKEWELAGRPAKVKRVLPKGPDARRVWIASWASPHSPRVATAASSASLGSTRARRSVYVSR